MYGISELSENMRKQLADSVRAQLQEERKMAVKAKNKKLIDEIDAKLSSLDDIYQLNEVAE